MILTLRQKPTDVVFLTLLQVRALITMGRDQDRPLLRKQRAHASGISHSRNSAVRLFKMLPWTESADPSR